MNYRSKIELHNIDCMEYMKSCKDKQFSLAICDPPYGININMNAGRRKDARAKKRKNKQWDNAIPDIEYFEELKRISNNQIIWGGNYFTEFLQPTPAWIFWNKEVASGVSFADGELAWTSFDRVLRMVTIPYSGFIGADKGERIHPTQKSIELYRWLLTNYAKEGDTIFDSHLGSCSIAIACDNLGFDLTGCEIDKEYFDSAVKRLAPYRNQKTLF